MISQLGTVAVLLIAAAKKTNSGSSTFIIFIVVIFAALYFLFLRPQQQRARKQREQKSAAAVGDDIVTIGGIVGRVVEVRDDRVVIVTGVPSVDGTDGVPAAPLAEGEGVPTRLEILRSAIRQKLEGPTVPDGASGVDEVGGVAGGYGDEEQAHGVADADAEHEADEHDYDEEYKEGTGA